MPDATILHYGIYTTNFFRVFLRASRSFCHWTDFDKWTLSQTVKTSHLFDHNVGSPLTDYSRLRSSTHTQDYAPEKKSFSKWNAERFSVLIQTDKAIRTRITLHESLDNVLCTLWAWALKRSKFFRLNEWMWRYSLNNIAANNTIGTTQLRSIRNPNTRFPIKAPPRPNVSDSAAAMTLWKTMFDENKKILDVP